MSDHISLEDIASLAKRRGFIYQGSDIYGGLAGTWDYGPLGTSLKRNITNAWWKFFVDSRDDMYGIESAILMNPKVWEASGHVSGFTDPLIEDVKTKKRFRLDHLLEDAGVDIKGMNLEQMVAAVAEKGIKSPDGNDLANPASFNLLFETSMGSVEGEKSTIYLRGETAQGMFVNFRNIVDSFYPNLPFGIAQIGKAFRNEISPRDFIFRTREFEIMEFEYFINPADWEQEFEKWRTLMHEWCTQLGLPAEKVHELEVPEEDRAHYSKRTIDLEYDFPFGKKELYGLAYRTDFDLMNHQNASGKGMEYRPKDGSAPFVPHVIEPTFGVDRTLMAVLCNAYTVDEMNGEKRIFLKLPKDLAPIKAAVSPLLKNKPELVAKAKEVYDMLKKEVGAVMWDDNGNIGKRYRRQDEIGTPVCITIDFQTLEDGTVTVRDRDTAEQVRTNIESLLADLHV
ncbi:MAG TPA: glycine--tRNA ligase [Candidatus Saccharimonadales bacterium]|jgi:glycyl-tRNA synthetase|nr:glycine--tRNA ligase [Candidatus Saccharimonadales bacterium]